MTPVIINGKPDTQIDYADRGFQYGDGLFETLAYKNGRLIYWQEHLQRLNTGCQRLGLPLIDEQIWLHDLKQLAFTENQQVIKLMLSRGKAGRGYKYDVISPTRIAACYGWPDYPEHYFTDGVKVRFCTTNISVNPALAGIKHMNRLDNVLARNEWSDAAIAEGLMLDDMAYVIEGTMSNLFAVKADTLYTPDVSRAGVSGIIRKKIIDFATAQGIIVHQTNITRQQLLEMDEVFLSNSLIGIWPVKQIEQLEFKKGAITEMLMAQLIRDETGHEL